MSAKRNDLKYSEAMREFVQIMKWPDTLKFDRKNQSVSLKTMHHNASMTHINEYNDGGSIIMYLEAYNDNTIRIYLYMTEVFLPYDKINEMRILLSIINSNIMYGAFEINDLSAFALRWRHVVNLDGSNPTGITIVRNVAAGFKTVSDFLDPIDAVAHTRQTAADAIK